MVRSKMASSQTIVNKNVATIPAVPLSNITSQDGVREKGAEKSSTGEFSRVPLDPGAEEAAVPVEKKVPRRILHFSDGILEEYSTDEEEDDVDNEPPVDPTTLNWLPWFRYYIVSVSVGALSVADYCGEKLAWLFGITSPKYQYAIDEYNRMKKEDEEEEARNEREKEAERRRMAEEFSQVEGAYESAYQSSKVSSSTVTSETPGVDNRAFHEERF